MTASALTKYSIASGAPIAQLGEVSILDRKVAVPSSGARCFVFEQDNESPLLSTG